jgi:hypothetical protein
MQLVATITERNKQGEQRLLNIAYENPLSLANIIAVIKEHFGVNKYRAIYLPPELLIFILRIFGLRTFKTKIELMGRDHWMNVTALRSLIGDDILLKNSKEELINIIKKYKVVGYEKKMVS